MGDDLNERIAKAQAELDAQARPSKKAAEGPGMSLGFRMAADFVAAVIVGAVLGFGIDTLVHTSPWGLVVCLILGFITGVWNIVRAANAASAAAQKDKGKDTGA
ncbi:MAG TPA: AtpZ/AtpI family protein [Hyphomonadaceae bacterium]|nr:AtpZ/AtpI family protein [Hyphomonadaceae bacterium]